MMRIDNKSKMNFKSLNRRSSERSIRSKVCKTETKMGRFVSTEILINTIFHQQFLRR